jgi:hypothetical protein
LAETLGGDVSEVGGGGVNESKSDTAPLSEGDAQAKDHGARLRNDHPSKVSQIPHRGRNNFMTKITSEVTMIHRRVC